MNRRLLVILFLLPLSTIYQSFGMLRQARSIRTRARMPNAGTLRLKSAKPVNSHIVQKWKTSQKKYETSPTSHNKWFWLVGTTAGIAYGISKEFECALRKEVQEELKDIKELITAAQLVQEDPTARLLIEDDPTQWLEREEKEVWDRLVELGVSKRFFEKYKEHYRSLTERDKSKLPEHTDEASGYNKALAHEVLLDFDIDPTTIDILEWKKWQFSSEASHEKTLIMNPMNVLFHDYIIKGIVAHEVQHITFEESLTKAALIQMRKTLFKLRLKKLEENESDDIEKLLNDTLVALQNIIDLEYNILRFIRFTEVRADTYACLKDPIYAQGLRDFASLTLQMYGEDLSAPTHPKLKTRIALAEKIIRQHEKAEKELDHNLTIQPSWL